MSQTTNAGKALLLWFQERNQGAYDNPEELWAVEIIADANDLEARIADIETEARGEFVALLRRLVALDDAGADTYDLGDEEGDLIEQARVLLVEPRPASEEAK